MHPNSKKQASFLLYIREKFTKNTTTNYSNTKKEVLTPPFTYISVFEKMYLSTLYQSFISNT